MAPRWVGFLVFLWIICALMSGVIEGAVVGSSESSALNKVLGWTQYTSTQYTTPYTFIGPLGDFFSGLFDLMTFRALSLMQGSFMGFDLELVRWIILSPFIAIFVFGMLSMFIGFFQKQV